jgi:hypothetical protein
LKTIRGGSTPLKNLKNWVLNRSEYESSRELVGQFNR